MKQQQTKHRAERNYQLQIRRNLKRNFAAHLAHGLLGQTGFRLLTAPTFLPAYVMLLSMGSNVAVGIALAMQSLGMAITPLLGANLIEHRVRVLPMGFLIGAGMRAMVLCIALAGLLLSPASALLAIYVFLALLGLFQGMQGVIFNVLMSKVIPIDQRGWLTGLRNFLAGITAASVAYLGGHYLIGNNPDAFGYSMTFLLAFALTSIGLVMLLFVREPQPPSVAANVSLRERLSHIPELLRDDPAFTHYFLARSLATMGRMAMPFYILYAGQTLGLSGTVLGTLTVAFTLSGTISNLVWGFIADRRGFRLAFLSSIGLWIASTLLLLFSQGLLVNILVFIGIGAATQGFQSTAINLTLEFGHRDDVPLRIAIANSSSEVAGFIGPLLGGILAAWLGYEAVFICSVAFLILGGAMVNIYVPEPRWKTIKYH
ncbi:MFS transporter [Gammaproteobacteria bacterium 54_18_T64]|nr:MFS transporter [Gammaproteobacteria bacterium 54_18_T64]